MNCQGTVTAINTDLWTITLNHSIIVHLPHLFISNRCLGFPTLNSVVKITYYHYNHVRSTDHIFLCSKATLTPARRRDANCNTDLLKIVEQRRIGCDDWLQFYCQYEFIVENLKDFDSCKVFYRMIDRVARHIQYPTNASGVDLCESKSNLKLQLQGVSCLKCVDVVESGNKGPTWSFGTQTNRRPNEHVLIGYLYVDASYGLLFLSDSKHSIACVTTNSSNEFELSTFLNSIVLIREYRVFSEVYRENGATNLEYVMFDLKDMQSLNCGRNKIATSTPIMVDEPPDVYVRAFQFRILKKSTVNLMMGKEVEFWLEVEIYGDAAPGGFAYLCLNKHFVEIWPLLHLAHTYTCYHSQELKVCNWVEVQRVQHRAQSYKLIDVSAKFMHTACTNDEMAASLAVEDAYKFLKEANGCISFEGVVKLKRLKDAIGSRTCSKSRRIPGFGTSGTKTHVVEFVNHSEDVVLTVFLNNWENLRVPIGLIPEMRVRVSNVLTQNKNYFKSCVFTNFEPISYEPRVLFDTVHLSQCRPYPISYLGYGDFIPNGVLIAGKPIRIAVRSLRMNVQCVKCDTNLEFDDCSCEQPDKQLVTTQTLRGWDEMGQFLIICHSVELLRLLIGLNKDEWDIWLQDFHKVKSFNYSEDILEEIYIGDTDMFRYALAFNLKTLNELKFADLLLVCRKFEFNLDNMYGLPTWYCIEAQQC